MESKIHHNNDADRRSALLALTANQPPHPGDCLTPSEMAMLVDGNCSPKELQLYHTHLGICENCYQEWLLLTTELARSSKGGKKGQIIRLFLKPKYLAMVGSSLAAAASLVVFLNIQKGTLPQHQYDTTSPPPVEALQEASKSIGTIPAPASIKKTLSISSQDSKESAPSTVKVEKPLPKQARQNTIEAPTATCLDVEPRLQKTQLRYLSEKEEPASPPMLLTWYTLVKEGCTQDNFAREYWQKVNVHGQDIPQQATLAVKNRKKTLELFRHILELTTTMDAENYTSQCQKLRPLLEEAPKTM